MADVDGRRAGGTVHEYARIDNALDADFAVRAVVVAGAVDVRSLVATRRGERGCSAAWLKPIACAIRHTRRRVEELIAG